MHYLYIADRKLAMLENSLAYYQYRVLIALYYIDINIIYLYTYIINQEDL